MIRIRVYEPGPIVRERRDDKPWEHLTTVFASDGILAGSLAVKLMGTSEYRSGAMPPFDVEMPHRLVDTYESATTVVIMDLVGGD